MASEPPLKSQFEAAQKAVNGLPSRPDNNTLLDLYGLFKQATVGDVQGKRPGGFDLKGKAKFDAWASRKGMSSDEAMAAYIKLVEELPG